MQAIPVCIRPATRISERERSAMYQTAYLTDVTDKAVLGDYWPGIQLYYPPVKYAPALGVYEDLKQAAIVLED